MLIPDTLFCCIKHGIGVSVLPSIDMSRVWGKRTWSHCTPEARAEHCRKMSQRRLNMSESAKKKASKAMSNGMKKYWEKLSPEDRKIHSKAVSDGTKKAWEKAEKDPNHGFNIKSIKAAQKVDVIKDVERINTYCGVITESQMEEISA